MECHLIKKVGLSPLDFKTRAALFASCGLLPNAIILPVHDKPCDKDWTEQVDSIIERLGFQDAVIFGGRDNSIEGYYSGKHPINIIEAKGSHSSTAIRKRVAEHPMACKNFRAGIIYHTQNRYPIVYSTVDIAVLDCNEILMGKKGDKFCFVGGFVDNEDEDLFMAAMRELEEETGINSPMLGKMQYEFSHKVKDMRYKNTKDCIMTHFFSVWTIKLASKI